MNATLVLVVSGVAVAISAVVVGVSMWQVLRRVHQQRLEIAAARKEAQSLAESVIAAAKSEAKTESDRIVAQARKEAEYVSFQKLSAAKVQCRDHKAAVTAELRVRRAELRENAIASRRRGMELEAKAEQLAQRESRMRAIEERLAARQAELAGAQERNQAELERVARLTSDAARSELVASLRSDARRDAAVMVRDIEMKARAEGESRAREIVVEAMSRVASEQTAESSVSVIHLPGDEMKGRIIGRDGRNIRAFESVTGVNVIIDDTPESVLLSSFDSLRREVARRTLAALVTDGRIHPHRIEEAYLRQKAQVEQACAEAGADAVMEVGVADLHPTLVARLGTLQYRSSYGQNVLKHLVESAHVAGIMAAELGMDISLAKRCAFLHDIGKALTHESEGSHAIVGAELARRHGEHSEVVHAIEAHHDEVAPQTMLAVLTQAADACSGGRPGARRENPEVYVKRLERMEQIAGVISGVEKVFAMQAGREVRVMVSPAEVDDASAYMIARDVAKQIEQELIYPGQVRVTVVRELRVTETAH